MTDLRIPETARVQPLPNALEAVAQRMRKNRGCPERQCLACQREVEEARLAIIQVWNAGVDAGCAQWPELAADAVAFADAAG